MIQYVQPVGLARSTCTVQLSSGEPSSRRGRHHVPDDVPGRVPSPREPRLRLTRCQRPRPLHSCVHRHPLVTAQDREATLELKRRRGQIPDRDPIRGPLGVAPLDLDRPSDLRCSDPRRRRHHGPHDMPCRRPTKGEPPPALVAASEPIHCTPQIGCGHPTVDGDLPNAPVARPRSEDAGVGVEDEIADVRVWERG